MSKIKNPEVERIGKAVNSKFRHKTKVQLIEFPVSPLQRYWRVLFNSHLKLNAVLKVDKLDGVVKYGSVLE